MIRPLTLALGITLAAAACTNGDPVYAIEVQDETIVLPDRPLTAGETFTITGGTACNSSSAVRVSLHRNEGPIKSGAVKTGVSKTVGIAPDGWTVNGALGSDAKPGPYNIAIVCSLGDTSHLFARTDVEVDAPESQPDPVAFDARPSSVRLPAGPLTNGRSYNFGGPPCGDAFRVRITLRSEDTPETNLYQLPGSSATGSVGALGWEVDLPVSAQPGPYRIIVTCTQGEGRESITTLEIETEIQVEAR